jgi:hypothetical protein
MSSADEINPAPGHDADTKSQPQHAEAVPAPSEPLPLGAQMDPAHRAAVEKSMLRKLDLRCSLFVLIYIMNYLDRNNIAAARLRGLQEDLQLNDTQYATCLSILYVGYILMQVRRTCLVSV